MGRELAACTPTLTFRRAGRVLVRETRAPRSTRARKKVVTGTLQATYRLRWCTPVHEPDPGDAQQSFYHSIDTPSVAGRGPHLCQRLGYAMPMTPGPRPRPTDAWPRPGPRPGRASAWAWASAWAGVLGCAHGSLLNNYRTTTEQPIEQLGEQLVFSSCFARNGGFQEVPKALPPLQRT